MKGLAVLSTVLLLCVCISAAAEPAGGLDKQLENQKQELDALKTQVAQLRQDLAASKGVREGKLDNIVAELSSKDKSDLDPPLFGNFEGLTLDGQIRVRTEWWNEADFDTSSTSDNAYTLMRTRLGFGIKVDEDVSAYIQMQDSRVWGIEWAGFSPDPTLNSIRNTDLHQAYIDWETPYVEWKVRAGRQELSFGSERIIGKDNWGGIMTNNGRAFDGLRVTFCPTEDLTIDGFAAKVWEAIPFPVVWSHNDQDMYGVYGSYKGLLDKTLEGYVLLVNDTMPWKYPGGEPAHFLTVGGRLLGGWNALGYEVEAAAQNGDWGTDNLDGWAFRFGLDYALEDLMWSPKLGAEYNWASGDHNAADGHDDTFKPLFASSHLYGQMGLVGWQNTSNVGLNVCATPVEKWSTKLSYWLYYREDEEDSAYDDYGRSTVPVAMTDEQLGWELDLNVKYQCTDALSMEGGYSRFMPGNSITDTGVDDDADLVYLHTALTF